MSSNDNRLLLNAFDQNAKMREVAAKMDRSVKYKELGAILAQAAKPTHAMIARVANEITRTDLSVLTLAQLLIKKGVFTQEEYEAEEADVTKSFAEATGQQSPAQQEAQAAAPQGAVVERLVEPAGFVGEDSGAACCVNPGACTVGCDMTESVSRSRLVEG